ncbi:MAG TPA: RNA polymerase-binding protein DksA [Burkholderiaceae bacterium]|jgi:DnaK suppressor protein
MNATVTKKSAKKSVVATGSKKAAIKPATKPKAKPATRATGKAPVKSAPAKTAKKVVSKAKAPVKAAVKTVKSAPKPAKKVATPIKKSVKPTVKPAAKVAKKAVVKTAAKPIEKKVSPTVVKISKVMTEKSSPILQSTDTTHAKTQMAAPRVVQNVAIATPNMDFKVTQSIANKSIDNASAGLTGKIEFTEVSKVSKVATKSTTKPVTDGPLLTEEQILKMSDKDYMNEAQLAFFKARLQQLEIDLLKNAGETTEHLRETVLVPDPADRATIEEEHALELRTRDRERKLLKKVQQSIASIDSGDYGWCEETGEPIGIPRLLARPTATLSLEAQQRRELKQKLYGD